MDTREFLTLEKLEDKALKELKKYDINEENYSSIFDEVLNVVIPKEWKELKEIFYSSYYDMEIEPGYGAKTITDMLWYGIYDDMLEFLENQKNMIINKDY